MNNRGYRRLRRRMLTSVLGSISVLMVVMISVVYIVSGNMAEKQIRGRARQHSAEITQVLQLGSFMNNASTVANMLDLALKEHPFPPTPEIATEHIEDVLNLFPQVIGCGYFFEPFAADPAKEAVWFYGYRLKDKIMFDDPEDTYLKDDWYRGGVNQSHPTWSKPYVDSGATFETMVTYNFPILREGKVIGLVGVDVALSAIEQQLQAMAWAPSSSYFLLSSDGRFLMTADTRHLPADQSLADIDADLARRVVEEKAILTEARDPLRNMPSLLSSYPISETGLILVCTTPTADLFEPARLLQQLPLFVGIVGLIALFFVTRLLAASISQPIERLTETVKEVSSGNFEAKFPGPIPKDEIGELAVAFDQMTADLRQHIAESKASAAAKARLDVDLHISREIQMGLIPLVFPAFPDRKEFDLHAIIHPAREVGGDFYDYYLLSEDKLCFVIGDVSDKGIPAALFMAITKTLVEAAAKEYENPARTAEIVNRTLQQRNEAFMFVTCFLGILEYSSGRVTYCNAGHNPPLLHRASTGAVEPLTLTEGAALGAMPDILFENGSFVMEKEDTLLLYTDGVTEAMNAGAKLYQFKRLIELIKNEGRLPLQELTAAVYHDVGVHVAGAPQSDDIAILALRYFGRS